MGKRTKGAFLGEVGSSSLDEKGQPKKSWKVHSENRQAYIDRLLDRATNAPCVRIAGDQVQILAVNPLNGARYTLHTVAIEDASEFVLAQHSVNNYLRGYDSAGYESAGQAVKAITGSDTVNDAESVILDSRATVLARKDGESLRRRIRTYAGQYLKATGREDMIESISARMIAEGHARGIMDGTPSAVIALLSACETIERPPVMAETLPPPADSVNVLAKGRNK